MDGDVSQSEAVRDVLAARRERARTRRRFVTGIDALLGTEPGLIVDAYMRPGERAYVRGAIEDLRAWCDRVDQEMAGRS
jgi:hypothetical protein